MRDVLHMRMLREVQAELRRADLVGWMREHRAEVEALIAEGELDWAKAATQFAMAGLRVDGRIPDAASAEAAWRRAMRRR